MKNIKRFLAIFLILLTVAAIPAVATDLGAALPPTYVGRVTLEAMPENWNPIGEDSPGKDTILALTAETLYRVTDEGGIAAAQAALPLDMTEKYAGSYGIPKNARRGYAFAIDIREDAFWEDGKAVSAADWYFTIEKWLAADRFPLEIANYRAFLRGDTKPSQKIVRLKEAGFDSVAEAEAAGYSDFYIDITHFWGLDVGWLRITDRTALEDAAIPSGCEEMYLTAEYLYRNYLSDSGSQKMFQSEFVGIPEEAGEKLAITDVGLVAEGNRILLVLQEPAAPAYVAAALADLIPLRPSAYSEDYGSAGHYVSCGPYRIVSVTRDEIELETNPYWTGEEAEFKILRCLARD